MRILLLPSALLLSAFPFSAEAGSFTITNERAPIEVSEQSRIYLDGKLVAVFHLDEKTPRQTVKINTPQGRVNHTYTLCGQVTILDAEGRTQIREVNASGSLHNPNGHHLSALGNQDFTKFYLDDLEDHSVADHLFRNTDVCERAIS